MFAYADGASSDIMRRICCGDGVDISGGKLTGFSGPHLTIDYTIRAALQVG